MSLQETIIRWQGKNDADKKNLAVGLAIFGTGLIFIVWAVFFMIDINRPAPAPAPKETAPVAVIDQRSTWQKVSEGLTDTTDSILHGARVMLERTGLFKNN
ncbi:MAG: hypothetical protein UV64_C0004G0036 [Parcubacteria group bacterium GW2011_GWC1_43_11b]|uniref:Uncharacterized protein n=1 Tax=Candidatus Vogelbacteria bacterium RIFOXYB1_FULL_42_16 TaxID=1802436 RepID=A0A1G2QDP4_9BACT|nr:MAG: hypothetical protein UV50_C0012G0010 [Parcubacteria group bacterium GW2011_GWB1_42_9]KKS89568.1 MAG: hypothetical protein UV64_C0004G0036 [Parcubacteria group bacterium GW2011_GWC1_43_11b]KKT09887.1 MAG: hypothetical protein UV88_C0004G0038 [Parcubacteria group bacterium GW2011_GWA1_43_21]OHA58179.1 MAG: hypothetical protein A2370_00570 [Candidatus Vogelbacteria bacterium RIFOXYB1_FULL_42_16]